MARDTQLGLGIELDLDRAEPGRVGEILTARVVITYYTALRIELYPHRSQGDQRPLSHNLPKHCVCISSKYYIS